MKSRHEPVPQPEGQSASRPERLLTQPCPDCFSRPPASRVPAPSGGASGLSFCGVLPPSLLSSFVFPCWFPGSCLEAGGPQWPLRPSEGLAGVVVPHLLVAVRFHPTREGSGTKNRGRRPKYRASFQVSLQYVRRWYVFGHIYRCSGSLVPCIFLP